MLGEKGAPEIEALMTESLDLKLQCDLKHRNIVLNSVARDKTEGDIANLHRLMEMRLTDDNELEDRFLRSARETIKTARLAVFGAELEVLKRQKTCEHYINAFRALMLLKESQGAVLEQQRQLDAVMTFDQFSEAGGVL